MTTLAVFLGVLASIVLVAFLVLSVVTLGLSVVNGRTDRNRSTARTRVREGLFERQLADDPDWEEWVSGLSLAEREELESVLERYLRNVSGAERRQYQQIARHLGMGERADEALDRDAVVPRLRALARLSLLSYPIDRTRLFETCLDHRETREAAARLVCERRDEFEYPGIVGTLFVLWDSERGATPHGLETLYDLNDGDPLPLLIRGSQTAGEWDPTVLEQACAVLGHCQATGYETYFEWIFPLFDHEDPRVRAGAIQAFRQQGWRPRFRARIPFQDLLTDEDGHVRRSTYRVLAEWGDEQARQLLEWAVIDEDDSRCQLTAVRALATLDSDPDTNSRGWPAASWDWVRAERSVITPRQLRSAEISEVTL